MPNRWDPVYTPEQREAMALAYTDLKIRPAHEIVRRAAAGELLFQGKPLPPFEAKEATVRTVAKRLLESRAGEVNSALLAKPPKDITEAMRRRLVNVWDVKMRALERKPEAAPTADLRELARLAKDIDALPLPNTEPVHEPKEARGQAKVTATQRIGTLLAAHRTGETVQEHPHHKQGHTGKAEPSQHSAEDTATQGHDEHGSRARTSATA